MINLRRMGWLGGALMLWLTTGVSAQQPALPGWIAADSAGRTVTLKLEAAGDSAPTLSGEHHGSVQVVVPFGWTVRWEWLNADPTARHSLVLMAEREKLPTEGGRPAIDNALSRAVTAGLAPGQRDVATFVADPAGWFWLLCGVPGHAIRGEWIGLKIDREAGGISVRSRP